MPGVSCLISGEVRYLSVDFGYCWVSGVVELDFVAVSSQCPNFGREAGLVIFTEAGGDSFLRLRDAIVDFLEGYRVFGGVGGLYGLGEAMFGFCRKGVPIGSFEVCETFSCPGWGVVVCEVNGDWEVV